MTGRDLIIYILSNGLENEPIVKDGKLMGFMTVEEAACKMRVGVATIHVWIYQRLLDFVSIGDAIYIPANSISPLQDTNETEDEKHE
jgi:hypothetical protein